MKIKGWTEAVERKYPGSYNARRDNLESAWRNHFGVKHGILVATSFFENVSRHRLEQRDLAPGERDDNVILEFRPRHPQAMAAACVWSDWAGPGQAPLLSFAAVTDDPPPEIAIAGHDRCIIPIRRDDFDAWLQPAADLIQMYAIIDNCERPYYEYHVAA